MTGFPGGLIQESQSRRALPFVQQIKDVLGRSGRKHCPEGDARLHLGVGHEALGAPKRVVPFNFDSAQTLMRSNSDVTVGDEIS